MQEAVVKCLGPTNQRVCSAAVEAIEAGDVARVGELMVEAQEIFDKMGGPISPTELVAPVLHKVLAHPPLQALIHGRKGVGSGGDGTAQFLCKDAASAAEVAAIFARDFPEMFVLPLVINGGSQVRRAVIPAAGFNSGLFPATKAMKANLFPIIDNGVAKVSVVVSLSLSLSQFSLSLFSLSLRSLSLSQISLSFSLSHTHTPLLLNVMTSYPS